MILKNTVYYNEAFLPQKGDIAVENEILAQVQGKNRLQECRGFWRTTA